MDRDRLLAGGTGFTVNEAAPVAGDGIRLARLRRHIYWSARQSFRPDAEVAESR